jgi:hypothetical protein
LSVLEQLTPKAQQQFERLFRGLGVDTRERLIEYLLTRVRLGGNWGGRPPAVVLQFYFDNYYYGE